MMADDDLVFQVQQLRSQGLPDAVIREELVSQGFDSGEVDEAVMASMETEGESAAPAAYSYGSSGAGAPMSGEEGNIYERIESITESLIDEKWDELIAEVKKIVEWKEGLEEKQAKIQGELAKLKEDFTFLHQGVLGKLEEYDSRMRDVGTELKAVGKVFKDVVPEFVENVKELKEITNRVKK